jgi:hypothetical protein
MKEDIYNRVKALISQRNRSREQIAKSISAEFSATGYMVKNQIWARFAPGEGAEVQATRIW